MQIRCMSLGLLFWCTEVWVIQILKMTVILGVTNLFIWITETQVQQKVILKLEKSFGSFLITTCSLSLAFYQNPAAGSAHSNLTPKSIVTGAEMEKLENRTKEEIERLAEQKKNLNYGAYARSGWWVGGEGVTMRIPLKYLNIFFQHEFYYPMR